MNTKLGKILAEISAGELIDKITILQIKFSKLINPDKKIEVKKELDALNSTFKEHIPNENLALNNLFKELKEINLELWNIEEMKRNAEKKQKFDQDFIELSRKVYKYNDKRAKLKLDINNLLGSNIKEVKSY